MREDDGLDMTQKEAYLPDEEFQQVRTLLENGFHETWHLLVLFTCAIISFIWCILIVCSANIMRLCSPLVHITVKPVRLCLEAAKLVEALGLVVWTAGK